MKCFYHEDADGKCAGFWVAETAIQEDPYYDISFHEVSYRSKFPMGIIRPDEQVYIVDYSISPDEMRELLSITSNVTWIDHHKTAIEKYAGFEHEIRGLRYNGIAGCMLTYCYLCHMTAGGEGDILPSFDIHMTEDAPMFTKLIADWDVFKFDYGDSTRYFQMAFGARDFAPTSPEWDKFTPNNRHQEDKMIEDGKLMVSYRDNWAKEYLKVSYEVDFRGYKCLALNLGHCNSEYFKSLPQDKYDIFMPFVFDGSFYSVSLYSTKVDVSQIAIKYGGGGHRGASGFQCKRLPFRRPKGVVQRLINKAQNWYYRKNR